MIQDSGLSETERIGTKAEFGALFGAFLLTGLILFDRTRARTELPLPTSSFMADADETEAAHGTDADGFAEHLRQQIARGCRSKRHPCTEAMISPERGT